MLCSRERSVGYETPASCVLSENEQDLYDHEREREKRPASSLMDVLLFRRGTIQQAYSSGTKKP